jgi:hypothetical protein
VRSVLSLFGSTVGRGRVELRRFVLGDDPRETEWLQGFAPRPRVPELADEIARISREFGVDPKEVASGSRRREVSRARAAIAHLARDRYELGLSEVARHLGVTPNALVRGSRRGRLLAEKSPRRTVPAR